MKPGFDPHGPGVIIQSLPQEPIRIPDNASSTKFKVNRNWSSRYQDGKHKPKEKK